ncbi:DUF2062 domain-containing protein [Candidatus Woesearchaeota archaeon]|jgi:uncharacterized protein|nr:DUF2062 domain-containing protein [Candidatus Woesearchaeota archaeon]MBT6519802.1 DUF2062 domain-containing protein [Candidatus Woesearchaeota archaeon]MBT7368181.1 DUF2062 domain-containing protein [Candidatus Woesearchaeota archaeon]
MLSHFNLKKKFRKHIKEIVKTKKSAHSVAIGFAIGTFISLLPTPGFNILLGVLLVLIYEKVNKFSLFGSMAFWNPFVLAPIYFLSYKIGDLLFSITPVIKYDLSIINQFFNFSRTFLAGNLILALTLSVVGYFLVKKIVEVLQERHIIKNTDNK